ncbi:MAG TPA: hypothetical protein VKZ61_06675 [Thermomicrobiales bacterium]|nr:hypothetical protein [Thermomicrobiales bacterium]
MEWKITPEDHKLSKIAGKALHEERQRIQTDEGIVVLISEEELSRIERRERSLGEHLLDIPKIEEADFSRDTSLPRDVDL